jgi:hypothetical protein
MRRITGTALTIFVVSFLGLGAGNADPAPEAGNCQCPCPCPEETAPSPSPEPQESPETVLLKELVDVYEAVEFSHAEHADLAEEGCGSCHHHSPANVYKKCGACHTKRLFEAEKHNMLNLKAAYHRQCIECHVAWESGPTGCTECHEIRE